MNLLAHRKISYETRKSQASSNYLAIIDDR